MTIHLDLKRHEGTDSSDRISVLLQWSSSTVKYHFSSASVRLIWGPYQRYPGVSCGCCSTGTHRIKSGGKRDRTGEKGQILPPILSSEESATAHHKGFFSQRLAPSTRLRSLPLDLAWAVKEDHNVRKSFLVSAVARGRDSDVPLLGGRNTQDLFS